MANVRDNDGAEWRVDNDINVDIDVDVHVPGLLLPLPCSVNERNRRLELHRSPCRCDADKSPIVSSRAGRACSTRTKIGPTQKPRQRDALVKAIVPFSLPFDRQTRLCLCGSTQEGVMNGSCRGPFTTTIERCRKRGEGERGEGRELRRGQLLQGNEREDKIHYDLKQLQTGSDAGGRRTTPWCACYTDYAALLPLAASIAHATLPGRANIAML